MAVADHSEHSGFDAPRASRGEVPTRFGSLRFAAAAAVLQVRRAARDLKDDIRRWPQSEATGFVLAAESRSPLWSMTAPAEASLQRGKVENLRRAVQGLRGTVVPAGGVFSFWKQIGRASGGRGYVDGRELREGCLVPAVGGGLCQLSN